MSGSGIAKNSICFVGIENLLILAPEYQKHGIGGAQLQQVLLAKALARNGFDVSMVTADHGQPDGAVWDGVRVYKSYRMDAGLPGVRLIHPRASSIWRAMRRARSRLYYCSCADYLPGVLALFAQLHDRKTVFRIAHDTDCDPKKLLIPNVRSKVLYKYGLPRMDLILAQSSRQQLDMRTHFGLDSTVIPSLVELGAESRAFQERDIQVLWVGYMRPFKRPQLLLQLAGAMPEVSFLMVGGEDVRTPALYQDLKQRAARLPNLSFAGPRPYAEVEAQMARARLFVNTSESEGFPNTFMQSWARGTPVVSLFDPDNLISREGLGRAVANLDEMQSAIATLLHDVPQWTEISNRCRKYVADRHGTSAIDAYVKALAAV
jgi:glycosyltransferase involved in cell wall biosynthesis